MGSVVRDTLAVASKEMRHLLRDRRSQALTLLLPFVAMAVFALSFGGLDFAPSHGGTVYPLAVKDHDRSAESRAFVDKLSASQLFTLVILPEGRNETTYMAEHGSFALLIVPEGFGQAVTTGHPQLRIVYDNARPYVGSLAVARIKLVVEAIAAQEGRGVTVDLGELVPRGGPLDLFAPGIVVLLVAFTSLNDMASGLARERSEGTMGRVFISPIAKGAFLGGKILAGSALILLRATLILVVAATALSLRLPSSVLAYFVIVLLAGVVTLGFGILLAARARTDREVTIATLLATIVLMFMMGAIAPLELMSPLARAIASVIPHTYATAALRDVMLRGQDLGDEVPDLAVLAAAAIATVGIGVVAFRRRID